MHKLFDIPELLDVIFSYSSKHTNTVAARVCQVWFARAIPFVWYKARLNDIFRVLDETSFASGSTDGDLSPYSPGRIPLYLEYTRYLECMDVAPWRPPREPFFPKLTVLHWKGDEKHIWSLPPLLSPTLQILRLELGIIRRPATIYVLCNQLPTRSPSLHVLELDVLPKGGHLRVISRSVRHLLSLSCLSRLVSFSIPICSMSPESFIVLSRLPNLENFVLLDSLWRLGSTELRDPATLSAKRDSEGKEAETDECLSFRSLKKFEIGSGDNYPGEKPLTIAKAFGLGIHMSKLVDLTCTPFKGSDGITYMDPVPILCPNIQKMTIISSAVLGLPWQAIQVLLKCPALVELRVDGNVNMKLENILRLATDRSSWKVLNLPSSEPLSYQALVIFAQYCPDLVELGLKLDSELGLPDPKTLTSDAVFSSLTVLDFGYSEPNTSGLEIATFLARICENPALELKSCGNREIVSLWKSVQRSYYNIRND